MDRRLAFYYHVLLIALFGGSIVCPEAPPESATEAGQEDNSDSDSDGSPSSHHHLASAQNVNGNDYEAIVVEFSNRNQGLIFYETWNADSDDPTEVIKYADITGIRRENGNAILTYGSAPNEFTTIMTFNTQYFDNENDFFVSFGQVFPQLVPATDNPSTDTVPTGTDTN